MHPYDRYKSRCESHKGFNVLSYCNDRAEVLYNTNKAGGASANSWGRVMAFSMPVTWLLTCDLCKKTSTPKKIQYRSLCYNWHIMTKHEYKKEHGNIKGYFLHTHKEGDKGKNMLCMGCWNKVRVIVKAKNEADEIHKLQNKLNKESLKWLKSQTRDN